MTLETSSNKATIAQRSWICLCQPSDVRNIGGAIRAVANHNLAGIKIITPETFDSEKITAFSSGADACVTIEWYDDLDVALRDASLVVGTSRRTRSPTTAYQACSSELTALLESQRSAHVLFGNERIGLTAEESKRCRAMVEIPSAAKFPSLNLAQAVACIGYELNRPVQTLTYKKHLPERKVEMAKESAFYQRLNEVCESLEYPPGRTSDYLGQRLRPLLQRANPSESEYGLLLGIFRELERLGKQLKNDKIRSE